MKANTAVFTVTDTGIGMNKETVDQLFRYNDDHKSHGTSGESSSGMGLLLCGEFLKKNDAKIVIDSEPMKGTVFSVTFPLYSPTL